MVEYVSENQTILHTTIHHLASCHIHGGGEQEAQRREDQEAASISSVSSLFIVNSEGVSSVQFSYQWEVLTVEMPSNSFSLDPRLVSLLNSFLEMGVYFKITVITCCAVHTCNQV